MNEKSCVCLFLRAMVVENTLIWQVSRTAYQEHIKNTERTGAASASRIGYERIFKFISLNRPV
jgi:hypothetical protein